MVSISELQEQRRQGELIKALMQAYNLSKASVYRYLHEIEAGWRVSDQKRNDR